MRRLVLGAIFAALLVLGGPATAERPAVHTVTVFQDDPDSPRPGSLRHILEKAARAGDTVLFSQPVSTPLRAPLEIAPRLDGLTIDGGGRAGLVDQAAARPWKPATGEAGFGLFVLADRVTIKGLAFRDVPLVLWEANEGVREPKVLGNRFEGRFSYLGIGRTTGALVRGNEFRGTQDFAIEAALSRRTVIEGNTFAVKRGGRGVDDLASRDLVVRDNVFEGTVAWVSPRSGLVAGNMFRGGGIVARFGSDTVLKVAGNDVEGADVGIRGECLLETRRGERLATGELRAIGNRVRGGRVGIRLACERPATRFEARANRVEENREAGILVTAQDVVLTDNVVTRNGLGIVFVAASTGRVRGGQVRQNRGAGVVARRGSTATVSRVAMGGNGGAGIDAPSRGPAGLNLDDDEGLRGTTCAGCLVEVYEAEAGDEHGEGTRFLGSVRAGADGRFRFPARGKLACPASGLVTVTSTRDGRTSEFSADVECACRPWVEFEVYPTVLGGRGYFEWYSVGVYLRAGTKVTGARLLDAKTGKPPAAGWHGLPIEWKTSNEQLVTVTYRGRKALRQQVTISFAATKYVDPADVPPIPRGRWRYAVDVERPAKAGCPVLGTWAPPQPR